MADDTDIVRVYLAEALRAQGFVVEVAADGLQALAAAKGTEFDLLLLDVRMPGLFGDLVLEQLRADAEARSVRAPAVAMSSEMNAAAAAALVARGFAAALGKPVPAQTLLDTVHRLTDPAHRMVPVEPAVPRSDTFAPVDWSLLPLLDDARAITALGKPALVSGLRVLFRRELALRGTLLAAAVRAGESASIRELIHQLLASCALCGATRLEAALKELRKAVIAGNWPQAQRTASRLGEVAAALEQALPTA